MLHILHVIESLEFGGAEKVVIHLANNLVDSYKVSICITKRQGELVSDVNKSIKVYFLNTGEGNSLTLPLKLKELIIKEKVDIIQCHNWGLYLESALAARLSGRANLIQTVHGRYTAFSPGFKSSIKIKIRHYLEKIASYYTFKIVPVSCSIKQYIMDDIHITEDKLLTIHNGIAGLNAEKNNTNDYSKYIKLITVGRLATVKNHAMLLNAFKLSHSIDERLRLTIVGDGPELNNLQSLAESLNIQNYVDFSGFRTDISDMLISHDIFLMSSNYEGVSIAILEAMSMSMPVIATNVGGNPEVVINDVTGLIVDKNNAHEFSSAINKFTHSTDLIKKYGDQGNCYFTDNFHESVVLKQYTELYEGCKAEK